ncbi:unnamed protein product [Ilex paraguariensis]|uniref:Uncharacterized protein n=1 Tax=Ilex paraguariensis TaxID=185542 RepID=A0ABC8T4C7_9AQUA
MEDPDDEWEYTPPESEGKVNWILNRGLGLGKKVVITAIVISSAPVVLPPLLMISTLGFAFSVPFGVVFATYACTEKLMSKLLPSPASSLMLEYETVYADEEGDEEEYGEEEGDEEEYGEEEDLSFEGVVTDTVSTDEEEEEAKEEEEKEKGEKEDVGSEGVVMDRVYTDEKEEEEEEEEGEKEDVRFGENVTEDEETEKTEDAKKRLEMRVELEDDGSKEIPGGDILQEEDDPATKAVEHCMEEPMEEVDYNVKEEGHEEDVGEYLDDKEPMKGVHTEMGVRKEGKQESVVDQSNVEEFSVEVRRVVVVAEGDESNESVKPVVVTDSDRGGKAYRW